MRKEMEVARVRSGMTQGEIAKRLDVSRGYYCSVENGRNDGSIGFWRKFQSVLKVNDADMWGIINEVD